MPSVEELLSVAEAGADTRSTMDNRIEIDAYTRIIHMMPQDELFGVESDEKSERKYFKVPKIVGNGVDLSKLQLRINYQNASKIPSGKDMYIVTDATVYNDEWVYFSWELSRKVTQYKGNIYFIVCAVKADSNGNITNEWNTTLAEGKVLEGLEVETSQEQQYQASDYLEQLKQQLLDYSKEIKDTFPSDYTQMQNDIGSLKGDLTYVNDKFSYSENRLTLENLEADKYIARNGSILSYPGWSLSTFLPVEPNTTYIWIKHFNGGQVANIYLGLFDKNKKWIGNGGLGNEDNIHLITTDENTAYVRVSQASKNFTDDAMICRKELFDNGLSAFIPFSVDLKNNSSYALKSELIDYALKSELSTTNDKSIAYTINRFGSGYGQYESFDAVKKAIKAGFNGVRLNLQFSSDGEIVLWHDPYLNQHYSNVYDGNNVLVEYSDTSKVYINGTTFEELNQYKFGDKSYSAGVLTLTPEILPMLKNSGSILVLEQKSAITVDNATKVMNLLYKYGMVEKTYFACSDANTMDILYNVSSIPHYGLMHQNASENLLNIYEARESYKLFWWAWDTTSLTEAQAIRLKNIGTVLWAGDFYTADNIIKFLCTDANNNFTGFETSVPIISDILKTNYIN